MTTVQTLCHRALLLHDGELRFVGEPEDAALRYYRMNFAEVDARSAAAAGQQKVVDVNARVVHAALVGEDGRPVASLAGGAPILLDVVLEAARPLQRPSFIFHVRNADGAAVFEFVRRLDAEVDAGRRVRLAGTVENRLVAGRYSLDVYIREDDERGGMTVQGLRLLQFAIDGVAPEHGLVSVRADVEPALEPEP
jgi:hypothetical protein